MFGRFISLGLLLLCLICVLSGAFAPPLSRASSQTTSFPPPFPSDRYDLSQWKLQYPGTDTQKEIKDLTDYQSAYFRLKGDYLQFSVSAAEKGHSRHSEYVRSELRHLAPGGDWKVGAYHSLKADIRVAGNDDKITVAQIHGIKSDGSNVPPLLRICAQGKKINAYVKTNASGSATRKYTLADNYDKRFFAIDITVEDGKLYVSLDGKQKLKTAIAFWPWENYFKIGAYPNTHAGAYSVLVGNLQVQ